MHERIYKKPSNNGAFYIATEKHPLCKPVTTTAPLILGSEGEKLECIRFAFCVTGRNIKIINVISATAATDKCNLLLVSLL